MKFVHHPDAALHRPASYFNKGLLRALPEKPERVGALASLIEKRGETLIRPDDYGSAPRAAVHTPAYLAFLETAHARWVARGDMGDVVLPNVHRMQAAPNYPTCIVGQAGWHMYDTACPIGAETWTATCAATNAAIHAAKLVATGEDSAAYALCRPPGHHAGHAFYGGYCFLNNAAVAAQSLRDGGAARVAVLDVDYHHGNGTQEIFWERGDVLFVSIHADPLDEFPYFCGHADETGTGAGEGANLNLTLPWGTDWAGYAQALAAAADRIREFGADALVLSLGADTYGGDPISRFRLLSEDFLRMGAAIAGIGLPTLFVMEGGYAVDDLGVNVANVLTGFARA